MKDGGRRGEVVLWPTLRLTDRAWRLLRHSIRVLSGAAQRGAVNRANRANAHGSCLLGVWFRSASQGLRGKNRAH